jgi:nuclease-like protein/UvrD-like helicase family protein/AAA domain-containing protein
MFNREGDESLGARAERNVQERLRAALPPEYTMLTNVAWLVRQHGVEREGEADIILAHPERGFLALEVKSGLIKRDSLGRWWAGSGHLDRSPFQQAADSHHSLVAKLTELPDWEAGLDPIAGHAVVFPSVDLASLDARILIGTDADPELILDRALLAPDPQRNTRIRDWVDRCYELWDTGRKRGPGQRGIELLTRIVTAPIELRSLLRSEIADGNREVARLTAEQLSVLNTLRGVRRAAIVGGAGTGKTMLAIEKAKRLALEGFETLLVCFNAPLAKLLYDETLEAAARSGGRLHVRTFHQLAEDLGREAAILPEKPDPVTPEWFERVLPTALDVAIDRLGPRFHAIVVDEGQDFDTGWLASLEGLLYGGREDVLYLFHDPGQAIFRTDQTAELGLTEFPLDFNCRNAQPIHSLLLPFAKGGLTSMARRRGGREPELIKAEGDQETIDSLRGVLHRLVRVEGVAPGSIAVLTGVGLEHSAVWRQRQFGNEVLWNGAYDDAGRLLGLRAEQVPAPPRDVVLCESIRRFKGLERPVVIFLEVPRDDPERLDRFLYIAASRAIQHLVAIVPLAIVRRLTTPAT